MAPCNRGRLPLPKSHGAPRRGSTLKRTASILSREDSKHGDALSTVAILAQGTTSDLLPAVLFSWASTGAKVQGEHAATGTKFIGSAQRIRTPKNFSPRRVAPGAQSLPLAPRIWTHRKSFSVWPQEEADSHRNRPDSSENMPPPPSGTGAAVRCSRPENLDATEILERVAAGKGRPAQKWLGFQRKHAPRSEWHRGRSPLLAPRESGRN